MVLAPFFDITVFVAALTFRFLGERLKDLWRKEDWGVRVEEEEEEEEKRERLAAAERLTDAVQTQSSLSNLWTQNELAYLHPA